MSTLTHTLQKCPICDGQGIVNKPASTAGDQETWISNVTVHTCPYCNGEKVIMVPTEIKDYGEIKHELREEFKNKYKLDPDRLDIFDLKRYVKWLEQRDKEREQQLTFERHAKDELINGYSDLLQEAKYLYKYYPNNFRIPEKKYFETDIQLIEKYTGKR